LLSQQILPSFFSLAGAALSCHLPSQAPGAALVCPVTAYHLSAPALIPRHADRTEVFRIYFVVANIFYKPRAFDAALVHLGKLTEHTALQLLNLTAAMFALAGDIT